MSERKALVILASTTGAGNSDKFYVDENRSVTITSDVDLAGVEVAAIEISPDNGVTFRAYLDGIAVELTATKNAIRLYGPAVYRVAKGATASATAIILQG